MGNYLIFVVISVLVVMLIYGSITISPYSAFAAAKSPRDVCQTGIEGLCICKNDVENLKAKCCEIRTNVTYCMTCDINTDTGDYENCVVSRKSPTTGTANVPQGGGVLEQPKHPKHGGTVSQGDGGVLEQPQSSNHSPKENTKLPNDNGGSTEQHQEQSSPPLKPKGGHNINPATGSLVR